MTNNRKKGALGLSVPVINPSNPTKAKLTPSMVVKWCASLPMADTGAAAKKMYLGLSDLNSSESSTSDRFEVVEQLRVPLKNICTTLKKHYIEQRKPLTEQKVTIANLRQSLLTEMVDNYKTIFDELASKTLTSNQEKIMLITTICRILYYFNSILICRYQLYSYVPESLWSETHLLYKYAKKNNILKQKVSCSFSFNNETTSILESYAHIILLSATDPYQWRQAEQHSLNKISALWALEPIIYESAQIPSEKIGIYIVDLDKDLAPIAYGFMSEPVTASCIAFDLSVNVKQIKSILSKMDDDNLKIKMQRSDSPEFSATKPTLKKLMKIWSMQITRSSTRFPIDAKIKIAFGLIAAHFYINNQKEFNSQPGTNDSAGGAGVVAALPTFEVDEEDDSEEKIDISLEGPQEAPSADSVSYAPEKDEHYHIYDYSIQDMSPNGLCIATKNGEFPPFHAGEIVVFKNTTNDEAQWGIGAVRWIKRKNDSLFQIGIQLISPVAKAGGIQMIRDDKPIGHLLRCLILPAMPDLKLSQMLITATPPFHSNKVTLYVDHDPGLETTLTNEIDCTDMYYQYEYTTKEIVQTVQTNEQAEQDKPNDQDNDQASTEFDSIWKDL